MAVMTVGLSGIGGVMGVSLPPPPIAIKPRAGPANSPKPIPTATGADGKNAITLLGLSKATLQSSASSCSVQIKLFEISKASLGKWAVT